jgi:hypothetical protein
MAGEYNSIPEEEATENTTSVSHQNYLVRSCMRLFFCCVPTKEEIEFMGTRILKSTLLTILCYFIFRYMINSLQWDLVITMSTIAGCILTVVAPYSIAPCVAGVIITYQRGIHIVNMIVCMYVIGMNDCVHVCNWYE